MALKKFLGEAEEKIKNFSQNVRDFSQNVKNKVNEFVGYTPPATPMVTPTNTGTSGEVIYTPPTETTTPATTPTTTPVTTPTPTVTNKATTSANTPKAMNAKDYANWLYSQSVKAAEDQKKATVEASNLARQRSIADANSSYAKSLATYGQNAEKLASMGLSGSGYGEYLTAGAYANNRAAVQSANAQDLATQKEALYQEGAAKQNALSKYYSDMLNIQTDQNNSYSSLVNSANNGATIEAIMANASWGALDASQQAAIKNIVQTRSFKSMIDSGTSIADIENTAGFLKLSADAKTELRNYAKAYGETRKKNADSAYSTILGLLQGGASIESVRGMSGYDMMSPERIREFDSVDAYNRALLMINNGKTYDDIMADPSIKNKLLPKEASMIEALAKESDEANVAEEIEKMLMGGYSWADIESSKVYQSASDTDKAIFRQSYNAYVNEAFNNLRERASSGESIASLSKDAAYNLLSDEQKADIAEDAENYNLQLEADKNALKNQIEQGKDVYVKSYDELRGDITSDSIDNLDDLRNDEGYKTSSETQKKNLDNLMYMRIAQREYAKDEESMLKALANLGIKKTADTRGIMNVWRDINLSNLIANAKNEGAQFTVAEIEDLMGYTGNDTYLNSDAIDILRSEGLIRGGYSSTENVETKYLNGEISANDLFTELGKPSYGGDDLGDVSVSPEDEYLIASHLMREYTVTVGNHGSYRVIVHKKSNVEESTAQELNKLSTGSKSGAPSEQTVAIYDGKLYMYIGDKWCTTSVPLTTDYDSADVVAAIYATR